MHEVISVEILNFLNFANEKKQLVGLRQVSGRRSKLASEAASCLRDHLYLGIQLTGLVYLCFSAYFLSLSLERLFSPGGRKELTKITFRAACWYLPQVNMKSKLERRVVRYE